MSDRTHFHIVETESSDRTEAEVARLLALAGPRPSAPDEVAARVKAAVRARWEQTVAVRRKRTRHLLAALAAAAVLVLATGTTIWYGSSNRTRPAVTPEAAPELVAHVQTLAGTRAAALGPHQTAPAALEIGGPIRAGTMLITPASGRVAIRTADGVSIRLDVSTRARVLSSKRLLLEAGAVYVDNAVPGAAHPRLEVHTHVGVASDVGTQFEARLDRDLLSVRVREGAVSVARGKEQAIARAGEELRLTSGVGMTRGRIASHDPGWAWAVDIAPPMPIEGRRLGEFLAWVGRETGWRVAFADTHLARASADVVLHGTIDGLTPAEALAAVLPTCGLRHRVSEDAMLIEPLPSMTR